MTNLNLETIDTAKSEIRQWCQSMLDGKVSYIEGTRQLLKLVHDAGFDELDDCIIPFIAIDTETDHIPDRDVRRLWSENAVARAKNSWEDAEAKAKQNGMKACTRLLLRLT